jgi:hypothetical protein
LRDIVLVNLEEKPYKIITMNVIGKYKEFKDLIFQIKEIHNDNSFLIIEEKKFSDAFQRSRYANEKIREYSSKGFADINPGQAAIVDMKLNYLQIIEDPLFNYLIKIEQPEEPSYLYTTKYFPSFNATPLIFLELNEEENISQTVKDNYNFLINNRDKIAESMKIWFWEEFVEDIKQFSDFEKEKVEEYQFEKGFEEYKKINPNYQEDLYNETKYDSDKFFDILNKVENAKIWEEKSKIFNEAFILKEMSLEKISIYAPKDTIYGNIIFNFDYLLDPEHGIQFNFENRKFYELY